MKKVFTIIFILSLYHVAAKSQIKPCEIKSPEASAYERIAEVPIGAYTGSLNFSIPIYTIRCGDLELPISLDYMGSAIRVDQEATWVGLNWMLNAGGAVTTKVAPSNANWSNLSSDWQKLQNFSHVTPAVGNDNYLTHYKVNGMHNSMVPSYGFNWFQQGSTSAYHTNDFSFDFYHAVIEGHIGDTPSFSASFFNQSLQFVYDRNEDSFFITGNKKNYGITGTKWGNVRITDGMGNIYVFGRSETTLPASNTAVGQPYSVTNYLTSVISPKGDTVKIDYASYGCTYPLRSVTATITDGFPGETNKVQRELTEYTAIDNQYVSCITCRDIVIRFDVGNRIDLRGEGGRKLEQVRILRKDNDGSEHLIKKYVFTYDYFTDNGVGGNMLRDYYCVHSQQTDQYNYLHGTSNTYMGNRLKLTSVREVYPDGSARPAYLFTYTTNALPGKQSAAQDYWGYYNGKPNTYGGYATIMPQSWQGTDDRAFQFTASTGEPAGDRRPDASYAEAGMLMSVTYPTGGTATFQYEANQFTNYKYLDVSSYSTNTTLSDLTLVSSEMEFMLPDFQRGHRIDTFRISRPTRVTLTTEFLKQNEYKTWQDLLSHYVIVQKMGYGHSGTITYEYPVETQVIRPLPADTLNSTSATVVIDKYLPAGKYQLSIAKFTQEEWSSSYHPQPNMIRLTLSPKNNFVSMGAGVRVKSVTMSGDNGTYTTEYDYTLENGEPSGKMMAPVRLARTKDMVYQGSEAHMENQGGNASTVTLPNPTQLNSYVQLTSYNQASATGTLVGYSRVTTKRRDSTNGNLGKTVTLYNNNVWGAGTMFDYLPRIDDPRNGLVLSETQYSYLDQLLQETTNNYTCLGTETRYLGVNMENIYKGPPGPVIGQTNPYATALATGCINIQQIPSAQYWFAKTSTSTADYRGTDTLTVAESYTYNADNMQVAHKSRSTSRTGETEETATLYPVNYTGVPFVSQLKESRITEIPVENVEILRDSTGNQHVKNAVLYRYDASGNPTEEYHLLTKDVIGMSSFHFSNNGGFTPYSGYQQTAVASYAANGNPREIIENETYYTVYIWGYHNRYPVAVVRNATKQQVLQALGKDEEQLQMMEAADSMDVTPLRTLLLTIQGALVTTYTYLPYVGMTSCTEPNGKVTTYTYDAFGRLSSAVNSDGVVTNEYIYNYKRDQ